MDRFCGRWTSRRPQDGHAVYGPVIYLRGERKLNVTPGKEPFPKILPLISKVLADSGSEHLHEFLRRSLPVEEQHNRLKNRGFAAVVLSSEKIDPSKIAELQIAEALIVPHFQVLEHGVKLLVFTGIGSVA